MDMRVTAGLPPFEGEDFSLQKNIEAPVPNGTSSAASSEPTPSAVGRDWLVNGDFSKTALKPNSVVTNVLVNGDIFGAAAP